MEWSFGWLKSSIKRESMRISGVKNFVSKIGACVRGLPFSHVKSANANGVSVSGVGAGAGSVRASGTLTAGAWAFSGAWLSPFAGSGGCLLGSPPSLSPFFSSSATRAFSRSISSSSAGFEAVLPAASGFGDSALVAPLDWGIAIEGICKSKKQEIKAVCLIITRNLVRMASTEAEVCCTIATFVERPEEVNDDVKDLGKKSGILRTGHHQLKWHLRSLFQEL